MKRDLKHAAPRAVLPQRARLLQVVDGDGCLDVLAEVDDAVVLLRSWKAAADVWVSCTDEAVALGLAQEVLGRMPAKPVDDRLEVRFTGADIATRYVDLATRPWGDVDHLYDGQVRATMDTLVRHTHDSDESRRLLLWHGAPGTGKTTAIRALIHAWRGWADGVVVTDPEELLNSGKYLRRVMLDGDDGGRWQLMVLEDAESLLHKGGGKGLAKLLNLCDGLLGQGLRCLFLITTNEPLADVHPALVRPGRCLARMEFGALPATQVAKLIDRPVDRPMTLAEVMAARPLTVVQEQVAVGQYL